MLNSTHEQNSLILKAGINIEIERAKRSLSELKIAMNIAK